MSDLPPGWEWAKLRDIVTRIEAGKSFTCDPRPARDNEWGVIKVSAMTWGEFRESENKAVPDGRGIDPRHEIAPGDLLVSRANTVEYVGAPVLVRTCRPRLLLSDKSLRLVVADEVDRKWLLHALSSPSIRRQISHRSTGQQESMRNVSQQALLDMDIPVPPLAEQRRIVADLEIHLANLDAAAAGVAKAAARLSGWRNVLANYAIGGGPKTRSAALDESWISTSIGDIADVGTGATPLRSRRDYYEGGTVPWVTSSAANRPHVDSADEFITEKALSETSVKLWPPGTLLVAMYGEGKTRGRCSELRISATTNQACAAIVMRPEYEWRRPWVKLVLRARYGENRKLAAGGVQPNLNLGMIRAMQIPLPPQDQQDRFLQEFERQDSVGAALEQKLRVVAARARVLRTALLAEAFAGRLVEQEPADEPASELLARIRAQRVVVPKQRGRRTAKELAAPATRAIGTDFQQGELPL
ncbi:restriction endonuclease subunit S [Micromonospora sp. LOL_023]|uniref:restriction endonuclease subunit S n=1 Tax=Micromonospora sp. LOL_023 TaxID=3345418 RepID=UPI003A8B19D4